MRLAGRSMLHISGRKKRSLSPRSYSWDRASPVTSHSQSKMYRQADRGYCSSGSATALPEEQGLAEHQPPVKVGYRPALAVHTAVAVADIAVGAARTADSSPAADNTPVADGGPDPMDQRRQEGEFVSQVGDVFVVADGRHQSAGPFNDNHFAASPPGRQLARP